MGPVSLFKKTRVLNTTTTLRSEPWRHFFVDALPLFQLHYSEIAHYLDIPLDVDAERYQKLDEAGAMRIYSARLVDGYLVGYCMFFVSPNMHYRSSLQASQDALYVHPEYRRSRIAVDLLEFSEQQLRSEGVQLVCQHVKIAHPALGKLLERRGYEAIDTIYGKRLDR